MRTFFIWSIWGLSIFDNQPLNSWLPNIYRQELHLSVQQALEFTLATHCISITSAIAVALAIDHVGRKIWIGSALLVGALSLLTLAIQGGSNPIFLSNT